MKKEDSTYKNKSPNKFCKVRSKENNNMNLPPLVCVSEQPLSGAFLSPNCGSGLPYELVPCVTVPLLWCGVPPLLYLSPILPSLASLTLPTR